MTEFFDIKKVAELFRLGQENSDDSDDDCGKKPRDSAITRNNDDAIVSQKLSQKANPYGKIENDIKLLRDDQSIVCGNDLEDDEHLLDNSTSTSPNVDWKKTPKWDIAYRQQVTSSDVFLQMGAKNPSTSSCENMVLTVNLPGEHMQNIDLKVLKQSLELISPNFALNIPLPHPVNPKLGNAQWDKSGEKLVITLIMDREFDFVNF